MTTGHGKHVFDAIGMTRVVIQDGKVVSVGKPELKYCPLFKKFRGMDDITPEMVKENIEFRIKDFGFCTENRVVRADDYITFGVSEILSTSLEKGKIDAAVIAADGCGTAVITDPYILQGLCGRISGLVETSPLKVVLDAVGKDNVVDPETVPVNMVEGSILADRKGHKRFSVTVCKPEDALRIRGLFGDRAIIVGVHTSHITRCGVETMFDCCDFLTACGSRWTREVAKERGVLVAGNKVEIFGITNIGKELVLDKLESIGKKPYSGEPLDEPKPLLEWSRSMR
ncbi:MAG: DUF2099 family protein [Candidatus Methanomethylophilaceae archaeon]|nr:DUF2099 family protein [Candidatus Methanomethylophilaceae archaeon]